MMRLDTIVWTFKTLKAASELAYLLGFRIGMKWKK